MRTAIAATSHPFNASHLSRLEDGRFRAVMITGEGESISREGMDVYGWGDRVEQWVSDRRGENWKLDRDLTPVKGLRYQNIQFVAGSDGEILPGPLLFYGWRDVGADGIGFLMVNELHGSR
ncbi:MAG: hypothetical protein GY953_58080 [bacterium]|nr:hypothetical protein [bacterium]